MSELAFNANGESFEIPATVGWRVRRMKPRDAPELVYGHDGRPLTVGIEVDIEELREAVGTAGKYRLDPINDVASAWRASRLRTCRSSSRSATPPSPRSRWGRSFWGR